jgi:hypothetical protein
VEKNITGNGGDMEGQIGDYNLRRKTRVSSLLEHKGDAGEKKSAFGPAFILDFGRLGRGTTIPGDFRRKNNLPS